MDCLWTETDLLIATGGYFIGRPIFEATGVSFNSRTLKKGDIFIALTGEKSDGHCYIEQALQAGAACVVANHSVDNITSERLLYVQDTLKALQDMGLYARARFKGKVIAITGSVGKTTTKEMLRIALRPFGKVHAAIGSYNNHIGVPLTLSQLSPTADFCICEIGMNHPGEIAPLAALAHPDIAIITEVSSAHLGQMGSLDAIAQEKSQIITALPTQGVAILPDDIYGLQYFEAEAKRFQTNLCKIGKSDRNLISIKDISLQSNLSHFQLSFQDTQIPVTLSSPGMHLVRNAALVLGAIHAMQKDVSQAAKALTDFHVGAGRGKLLQLAYKKGIILDESYNASIISIQAALATLRLFPAKRRIVILGDILEMGEHAISAHLSLLPDLLKTADLFFCCGSMMKHLFDKLPPPQRGAWAPSAKALIPLIQQSLKNEDYLLIKGSHSMHMDLIVNALSLPEKEHSDAL